LSIQEQLLKILKYILALIAIFTTHVLDQTYGDRVRSGCISEW